MSTADSVLPISPPPAPSGTLHVRIQRLSLDGAAALNDRVAVEAPLEYQLHHPALGLEPVSFGTTMRTPGEDEWLAAGLLYGEGIVNRAEDIDVIESSTRRPNVVNVRLKPHVQIELQTATRRFSAGSSCGVGVCGTTGLDAAIARAAAIHIPASDTLALPTLLRLPARMRGSQSKFGDTGGVHAAALFDFSGNLVNLAEDVGRHNAFDKLVGMSLMAGDLPLTNRVIVLSGRASFELVQKALRAGREAAGRHRRPLQSRRQSRRGFRPYPSGLLARDSLQRVFASRAACIGATLTVSGGFERRR